MWISGAGSPIYNDRPSIYPKNFFVSSLLMEETLIVDQGG
jgi:hypothetical protein